MVVESLKFVEDCNRIKRLQKDQQSLIEPMSHTDKTGLPRNKAASGGTGMPLRFKTISGEFVINFELSSFSGKNVRILKKFNPILFRGRTE